MIYVYFGHHKCASTWIVALLYSLCREAGLTMAKYSEVGDAPLDRYDVIADTGAAPDHLIRTSAYPFQAFHVIRDPRTSVLATKGLLVSRSVLA